MQDGENTNKKKMGVAHIALFLVALGSLGYSATNYIREELRYRDIMAGASRTGAGGPGAGSQSSAGEAAAEKPAGAESSAGEATDGKPAAGGAGRAGGSGMRGGFDPQQMAQRQLVQMSQQLKLTATQKAQIKAIQEKDVPRIKAVFDDNSVPAEQKWAKIRPLRAATDEAIKKVLNPAQRTQYAAQQAARAQQGGGRRGAR